MKVFVEAEENISVDTVNLLCLRDIGQKLADVSSILILSPGTSDQVKISLKAD